jgi:transcriptional regulator with XRE-family HTH domain
MPRLSPNARDPIDAYIGQAIRARRHEMGVGQPALAEAIGMTYQQINKYELGQNRVSASKLVRIARALSCKITEFIPEEDR